MRDNLQRLVDEEASALRNPLHHRVNPKISVPLDEAANPGQVVAIEDYIIGRSDDETVDFDDLRPRGCPPRCKRASFVPV